MNVKGLCVKKKKVLTLILAFTLADNVCSRHCAVSN